MQDIKKKIKNLPAAAGIYMMVDKKGEVLYVGKACSLKKRVGSHFSRGAHHPRAGWLKEEIADIKYFTTKSEVDALILECSLIKRYHPPYNIDYRDDKSYPFIRITKGDFPSISLVRIPPHSVQEPISKDHILFGPYPKVKIMKEALRTVRKIFPLRNCRRQINKDRVSPLCLDYHLGLCAGPCQHLIDTGNYRALVKGVYFLLKGERRGLARDLRRRMHQASRALRFEDAAKIKNQLSGLKELMDIGKPSPYLSGIPQRGVTIQRGDALKELQETLNLQGLPVCIEGFDISNISGNFSTGSLVVFRDGTPYKNGYRHFSIKTVKGINDVQMLAEIAERHYRHSVPPPDLVLVDGGIGQLNAVSSVLKKFKLNASIISLAKRYEEVFKKEGGRTRHLRLPLTSPGLQLLQHIRDEAHRFAIKYHRSLRDREMKRSALDEIPGIGERRKKKLLRHFGSVEVIREASMEELKGLGIPSGIAQQILTSA